MLICALKVTTLPLLALIVNAALPPLLYHK